MYIKIHKLKDQDILQDVTTDQYYFMKIRIYKYSKNEN